MSEPIADDMRSFDALTDALVRGVEDAGDFVGLLLLGSAAESGRARRDAWSDHDFFVVAVPGRGEAARTDLSWLPDAERIALAVRETGLGLAVVYDDGHLLEFAVGDVAELAVTIAGPDATVALDDATGTVAGVLADAQQRAASGPPDPAIDTSLALVKLLVGVGRVRRGERIAGSQLIRTWAVLHLTRAIRERVPAATADARDAIDPVRRFEADFPEIGAEIADALDSDAETAARRLFALTRATLEPGWPAFPTRAADAIATRLDWQP